MKKLTLCNLFLILISPLFSQVGVGTVTPNASAVIDLSSTTKGMLMPRMTTAQRDSIATPATGLMIFNLDDQCIDIYDGAYWIKNCGMKITGMDTIPSAWTQKADFGGTARSAAVGFSIGTKGYIGTGTDGALKKDFWEYDPATNAWTQKADFGGTARSGAVGFSIGTMGYIGTGFDGTYRTDFWAYNPGTNTWVQKAPYGGNGRVEAFSFSLSGSAIVGCGGRDNFATWFNDVYEYLPGPNIWVPSTNFPAIGAHSMVGITLNNSGYVGLGWRKGVPPFIPDAMSTTFYKYDPSGGTWTQMTSYPGTARHNAVGFSINQIGYVGTGFSSGPVYNQDFWAYDPVSNSWTQTTDLSGAGRAHATGFSIGTKGYLGTGVGPAAMQDFWEFDPYPLGPIYESSLSLHNAYSINDGVWTKENNTASTENKVDIKSETRTGTHPSDATLYVTGNMQPSSGGMEIRHSNASQGIGFGYNTVYAAGNNASQDISLTAKGPSGNLLFSTNGTQRMKITGDGKIGIGISTPTAPFQLQTVNEAYGVSHTNGNVEVSTYVSNLYGGWIGTKSNHPFSLFANDGFGQFILLPNGNIGIGALYPNAPLQFSNSLVNRKIVLYEGGNNDHQYYGLGVNNSLFRYQVSNTADDHVFFAGTSPTTSNELMRIRGTGNVSIAGVIETEAFTAPTLLNGFTNYGAMHATGAYYKDEMNRVHLRGLVTKATSHAGLNIFTLPAGYRPATSGRLIFIALAESGVSRIDIYPDGNVQVISASTGWISLDGISFRTD